MTVAKNGFVPNSNVKEIGSPFSSDEARIANHAMQPVAALMPDRASAAEVLPLPPSSDEGVGVFPHKVRIAYDLFQAAISDAAQSVECSNAQIAAEFKDLQARAICSIRQSALATIELVEAIAGAHTPGDFANKQLELARQRREAAHEQLVDFIESARKIASIMMDPLNRHLQTVSGVLSTDNGSADAGDNFPSRLNTLTGRQKMVLELLADGLPNKVIAYRLGISETTVKAHVGEILRKLKIYNRARVIVMLGQIRGA